MFIPVELSPDQAGDWPPPLPGGGCPGLVPARCFLFPLTGISPQDGKYYFDRAVIACKDGPNPSPGIDSTDGLCDCPDGTDEPELPPVLKANFIAEIQETPPCFLISSRVNDHICDCCDGSDEYDSGVICPNTCTNDESGLNFRFDEQDSTNAKSNDFDAQERISKLDLKDIIQNLKGFKVAIMVELVAAICVMTFFLFYRPQLSSKKTLIEEKYVGMREGKFCGELS